MDNSKITPKMRYFRSLPPWFNPDLFSCNTQLEIILACLRSINNPREESLILLIHRRE